MIQDAKQVAALNILYLNQKARIAARKIQPLDKIARLFTSRAYYSEKSNRLGHTASHGVVHDERKALWRGVSRLRSSTQRRSATIAAPPESASRALSAQGCPHSG